MKNPSFRHSSKRILCLWAALCALVPAGARAQAAAIVSAAAAADPLRAAFGTDLPGEERKLALEPSPTVADPTPPPALGPLLDRRFLTTDPNLRKAAFADWMDRLAQRKGEASLVPLAAMDPSRDVVVFCPGNGYDVQDAHALAGLEDSYDFLIGVSALSKPLATSAGSLARALSDVMRYRKTLAEHHGYTASRVLRIIGHSFGAATAPTLLAKLIRDGIVSDAPDALVNHVTIVLMAGPFRGLDLPVIFGVPGVVPAVGWTLGHIPIVKRGLNQGNLSFINGTGPIRRLIDLSFPDCVTVRLVTPIVPGSPHHALGQPEPVEGWHSLQMDPGELARIWTFYRHGGVTPDELRTWKTPLLVKSVSLYNLITVLGWDERYHAHVQELVDAARSATTVDEFAPRYDAVIDQLVATFHGQHTEFMWEDPSFMPWLRRTLER